MLLDARGLTKIYPAVVANKDVDIGVAHRSIHCLLGENGAGKSTFGNLVSGLTNRDSGDIYFDGEQRPIASPSEAIELGIGMVHQDFMLVSNLTVAENIKLGLPSRHGLLRLSDVRDRLGDLSATYGLAIEPDAYIWQLSLGQRQRVELLKALYREARLLILDEPTSTLAPTEIESLLGTFELLVADGSAIIFITHKISEALAVGEDITILRDGEVVARTHATKTDVDEITRLMIGRPVARRRNVGPQRPGRPLLQVDNMVVSNDRGEVAANDISITVRSGEIVGVAGIAGNGQRELIEAILGARRADSGELLIFNEQVNGPTPRRVRDMGVAVVGEDRKQSGVIVDLSVAENLTLVDYNEPIYKRHSWLDRLYQWFNPAHTPARTKFGLRDDETIDIRSMDLMGDYSIKAPSSDTPVSALSGGNIQRVVLAREFSSEASILVVSSPSRGLDVGATAYIHGRLLMQREAGRAVLLFSEDLDELLSLSDRILVMFEGRILGEVDRDEASADVIGKLMAGLPVEGGGGLTRPSAGD